MGNNLEIDSKSVTIKGFLKSRSFWRPFLAVLIGGIAGFLYYHFVGCTSGKCVITSNPYMNIIWGYWVYWGCLSYLVLVAEANAERLKPINLLSLNT